MNLSWEDDCFVCGTENPEGLRLRFSVDEAQRTIETLWVPREVHHGYTGVVHGGLVAAVLDEAVGKLSVSLG
ncbi:MAG: PaaI family thioesterase, partial [Proteobacteria bacterium]|nr:PaaI family thioesterase [Pseudomonadota bacterium]